MNLSFHAFDHPSHHIIKLVQEDPFSRQIPPLLQTQNVVKPRHNFKIRQ